MIQFPEFPSPNGDNSEIPGSTNACFSPGLIAACHVLIQRLSLVIHYLAYCCRNDYLIWNELTFLIKPMHELIN
jgi:hypothetical protein